jgi:hypothetical protein
MDSQVKLIFNAVKDLPQNERRLAIVRAGAIAEAYSSCDESQFAEVFGPISQEGVPAQNKA